MAMTMHFNNLWDVMLSSLVDFCQCYKWAFCLHLLGRRMNMEVALVTIYQTTWHQVPKEHNLQLTTELVKTIFTRMLPFSWTHFQIYLPSFTSQCFIIVTNQHISPTTLFTKYEVLSESSPTVIVVTASVKEDERGGQGHTSTRLLHQSATWHRTKNIHCFYMRAFLTSCFISYAMDGKIKHVSASVLLEAW
jgi:hypothetical protein